MSHALERVKILRPGRSFSAALLLALAALPLAARAQDVRPEAGTHTVKRGDTLWDLAHTYLGDAYLWPDIYRINADQIDDPHWIYPGEVLKLPGRGEAMPTVARATPDAAVEAPRRSMQPTVFATRTMARPRLGAVSNVPPARVPLGDVVRAAYFDRRHGPATSGRIMFGADIPGIDIPRGRSNYMLYDRVLVIPPAGSRAAEHDRFIAYTLGEDFEDVGTVVVPSAMLEIVRAPRDGEAAVAQIVALYTQLNADDHVVPLDTTGAGASGMPARFAEGQVRTTTVRAVNRAALLASLNYYVLSDLSTRDGMKIGDEIEIYRERELPRGDDGPTLPEVSIATAQVVRVTPYGSTARVLTQGQPMIRPGEHVRVTARMP